MIVSFAGDETLAKGMFKHIAASQIALNSNIVLDLSGDEIRIFFKGNRNSEMNRAKKIIELMIKSYLISQKLVGHKVTQLDNILTVGIPKEIDDISSLKMCEICGWRVTTEEELLIHRRTHWI